MEITRGKIPTAKRVLIYGPEGIGKSTLAAAFPDPVFIDTEGSTRDMDVARLPVPSSFAHLIEEINWVALNANNIKTLVIDTADWAEKMARTLVISRDPTGKASSIEDFGYGKGYVFVWEEMGHLLSACDRAIKAGVNIVMTAHAAIRKFEQPGDAGSYDRWELKLQNSPKANICAMLKEWADMVLFCNYEVTTFKNDEKKTKAAGGQRVMYTTHSPSFDAKNRYNLPERLPMAYESIKGAIESNSPTKEAPKPVPVEKTSDVPITPATQPVDIQQVADDLNIPFEIIDTDEPNLPRKLLDLMAANQVTVDDIQAAVVARGYMPAGMAVENYPADFIEGCLIGAWPQVLQLIKELKNK